jgi:nucleoside-diphosphate kinase
MKEITFIMIKPDGVRKKVAGEIISRIERKGYDITRMELRHISRELAQEHYGEHQGKPFYNDLIGHITSGPSILMVVEGEGVINAMSAMVGCTDPNKALPGTIRFDYATTITDNIIHRSDSRESAKREITLFFN